MHPNSNRSPIRVFFEKFPFFFGKLLRHKVGGHADAAVHGKCSTFECALLLAIAACAIGSCIAIMKDQRQTFLHGIFSCFFP